PRSRPCSRCTGWDRRAWTPMAKCSSPRFDRTSPRVSDDEGSSRRTSPGRVTPAAPRHARCHLHPRVEEELPGEPRPAPVPRAIAIKRRGDPRQLGEAMPGDGREIVVLHVIADVQRDAVERTIVAVRLMAVVRGHEMLLDEAGE